MVCVKENRLVDAEYSRRIFYFSKVLIFVQKNTLQTCKEIQAYKYNIFEWSLIFEASVDVNKIIYILIRESFYQYNK